MSTVGATVVGLLSLAVLAGIITMVVKDPQGANTIILSGADAVTGATRALEGR